MQTIMTTPSPLAIEHRVQPENLAEVLEYGTDADCRKALSYAVDLLGLDTIEELQTKLEEAQTTIEELESKVYELEQQIEEGE